jgi:CRISPR-associated protein Csa1
MAPGIHMLKSAPHGYKRVVYFLGPEELREVERLSTGLVVDESLRGWNYGSEKLKPPYDITLPVSAIAAGYCRCGRDVYYAYVLRRRVEVSQEARVGAFLHSVVGKAVEAARHFIYEFGPSPPEMLYSYMNNLREGALAELASANGVSEDTQLRNARKLWSYMVFELCHMLNKILSKGVSLSREGLAAAIAPFIIDYTVDGRVLGLSGTLRLDALSSLNLVFDLKTGRPADFHRLELTGYALALEANHFQPVNVGCITYLSFKDDNPAPTVKMNITAIDEATRLEFIEERDRKLRIIAERVDPARPGLCDPNCPYYNLL